jgi:hypothetical protein
VQATDKPGDGRLSGRSRRRALSRSLGVLTALALPLAVLCQSASAEHLEPVATGQHDTAAEPAASDLDAAEPTPMPPGLPGEPEEPGSHGEDDSTAEAPSQPVDPVAPDTADPAVAPPLTSNPSFAAPSGDIPDSAEQAIEAPTAESEGGYATPEAVAPVSTIAFPLKAEPRLPTERPSSKRVRKAKLVAVVVRPRKAALVRPESASPAPTPPATRGSVTSAHPASKARATTDEKPRPRRQHERPCPSPRSLNGYLCGGSSPSGGTSAVAGKAMPFTALASPCTQHFERHVAAFRFGWSDNFLSLRERPG